MKTRVCIYLLSGGTSPESAYMLDASTSGNDVFIITRAQLLPSDRNDNDDLYDARVGGVVPPPVTACSGSGCQGVPPAPPIFATPSSVTFSGVGNFLPQTNLVDKTQDKADESEAMQGGTCEKEWQVRQDQGQEVGEGEEATCIGDLCLC